MKTTVMVSDLKGEILKTKIIRVPIAARGQWPIQ